MFIPVFSIVVGLYLFVFPLMITAYKVWALFYFKIFPFICGSLMIFYGASQIPFIVELVT